MKGGPWLCLSFPMLEIFHSIDLYSWILLVAILVGLSFAAFLGKFSWRPGFAHDAKTEDELKIVLGATLSLFGLLIGFTLSFAISGYNTRMAAEENEAIAIGNAFQRVTLLQQGGKPASFRALHDNPFPRALPHQEPGAVPPGLGEKFPQPFLPGLPNGLLQFIGMAGGPRIKPEQFVLPNIPADGQLRQQQG